MTKTNKFKPFSIVNKRRRSAIKSDCIVKPVFTSRLPVGDYKMKVTATLDKSGEYVTGNTTLVF